MEAVVNTCSVLLKISMYIMFLSNTKGPCPTAKSPAHWMGVEVGEAVIVRVGVMEGVNVIVGGRVLVGVRGNAVRIAS